jgi:hypothetical protein
MLYKIRDRYAVMLNDFHTVRYSWYFTRVYCEDKRVYYVNQRHISHPEPSFRIPSTAFPSGERDGCALAEGI